jgi:hypothetical protein
MDEYWFESDEINYLFMTFDLSSLILLQEKKKASPILSANCLEKEFKAVIDCRGGIHWVSKRLLVVGLKN